MDCFYAACERLREPALRGEPVVVGMGYEPGETDGAVATASYEARAFGVESAQAISTALEALPRKIDAARDDSMSVEAAGFYRPVDMEYYESVAADIREILHERADTVREVSIDEAYLDLTDRCSWDETVRSYTDGIRTAIEESVGVTASVGVAPTMSAAKVASDREKPDGHVVVEPGDVRSFFADLPVEDVHGVGPVTARELAKLGIETAGDLASADPANLDDRFGERGVQIHRYARGDDDRQVEPMGQPKSLSRESAFSEATQDEQRQRARISELASAVADRANHKELLYQTIGVKVVSPPFEVQTRARSLPGPVSDTDLVEEVALDLFAEFAGDPVRKLGVRLSKLSDGDDQPALTAFEGEQSPAPEQDNASESVSNHASESVSTSTGGDDDEPRFGQRSLTDY
jgi:DNA polymerase IV (DinB-like DNA polymerase)